MGIAWVAVHKGMSHNILVMGRLAAKYNLEPVTDIKLLSNDII